MVAVKQTFSYLPNGDVDIDAWLQKVNDQYHLKNTDLIVKACRLAETLSKGMTTFYGQPCIEQGLEMAEIILDLKLDQEAVAAAIISSTVQHTKTPIETIQEQLGETIKKLITSMIQMDVINNLVKAKSRNQTQIDRLRKILLAMASDIRVVLIKLAERTSLMRGIKNINPEERKRLAQETADLYAPLANRLGIGQLKWELEDLAFHYTNPEAYKSVAKFLAERRVDREHRIQETISRLREQFEKANIHAELSGRAKHIYSIYSKMQQKDLDLAHIYDYSAVRILVPTLSDCYTALSIVHNLWDHIPEEFDDYISNPKSNGYRSIHTAVIGPDNKNMEIQIRTRDMHEEAEHGVAAHWLYKEKKFEQSGYETKITFLRQLLAWHKEVATENDIAPNQIDQSTLEDRVYVFTPAGDILDLPIGATPLDFAYQVHSELGHRCRGAKINKHIVPLTYNLQTGDQVEIITIKNGTPSRDWLYKGAGYLITPRARAKVAQWFRHQEITQYVEQGKHLLERELSRTGIPHPNLQKIATKFSFKDDDALFAAIGHGTIRLAHVLQSIQSEQHSTPEAPETPLFSTKKHTTKVSALHITGADDLLTRIARCCKPIPGDKVIGYITQGRGVTIHRKNCKNISHISSTQTDRFLDVSWDTKEFGYFYVDIQVRAYGRGDLLKDIPSLLASLKIDLIALNSTVSKTNNMVYITMTIQIHNLSELHQLSTQIQQLPNVADVKRIRE